MKKMMPVAVLLAVCAPGALLAGLSVNPVFMDNMILQRDRPVSVWGRGDAGQEVVVRFAGKTARTAVGADGRWEATLPALAVSDEGREMTVTMGKPGGETAVFRNVLVGDVWLCSGQSNMECSFGRWPMSEAMERSRGFCANAQNLRLLRMAHCKAAVPRETPEFRGAWSVLTGQVWLAATCVGTYFAQAVMEKTGKKIPIGLIDSSWGGMNIEPYINPEILTADDPAPNKGIYDEFQRLANPATASGRKAWERYLVAQKELLAKIERGVAAGRAPQIETIGAPVTRGQWNGCYQTMIVPMAKYPAKGVIWYQGCANVGNNEGYQYQLEALARTWRQAYGYELPFYWVQLSAYNHGGTDDVSPEGGLGFSRIREGMRRAMSTIPHGGMAVTFDLGNPKDIHPSEKLHVGQRLAQWALKNEYGFDDIVPSGPNYRSMSVEGDRIRVSFDYVGSGLAVGYKNNFDEKDVVLTPDAKLNGFAIAGADRKWFFADALIDGDTVVVSSKDVKEPVAVRYAYRTSPIGANLYNKELLPASPFRTDEWVK